ncbi:MAG: nucleotidyl transferase AbiEii/AbiGii toxin family protein [Myxococcota bacterium]|nr:nucleotidyl transferase AbiEii/AbiGii toxin family protein [Myxococcota bacterium]
MASLPSGLTRLQRRVLDALRPVAGRFLLTGGAALGGYHLGHRVSADIDLFVDAEADLRLVASALEAACRDAGWECEVRQDAPAFRRYLVRARDEESTTVDVAVDTAPAVEPNKAVVDGIRIDGLADIVVNKLCALLGRSSVKDLVDLYFLSRAGWDPLAQVERARTKDGGMDAAVLARVLAQTSTDPSALVLIQPISEPDLRKFRDDLTDRLLRLAWPP